jgi:hypothetical protein
MAVWGKGSPCGARVKLGEPQGLAYGALGRTRTCDRLLRRQLLFQLSYERSIQSVSTGSQRGETLAFMSAMQSARPGFWSVSTPTARLSLRPRTHSACKARV